MSRTLAVLMLTAVQVVWLFPSSGAAQWLVRNSLGSAGWLHSSYGTYFALWLCWGILGWGILLLHADSAAATSFRRVLVAFPLLILWDGLFSQHPAYPVESVNELLSCWVSAAVVFLLSFKISGEITEKLVLGVLALEALFALMSWNTNSRTAGGFTSPNLLYPLMLYGMLRSSTYVLCRKQWHHLAWGALAGVFAAALGATGNRIGMIAAILAVCWMIRRLWLDARSPDRAPLTQWKLPVMVVLLVPLAIGWYLRQEQAGVATFSDRSVQGRPVLWWAGLQVAWASHGLGCGVANYLNAQEQLHDLRVMVQGSGNMEPKNLFIAMVAIYGIPGLWYILSLCTKAMRFFWQCSDEKRLVSTTMFFALLLIGTADTPILIPERASPTFLWLQWMMLSSVSDVPTTTSLSHMRRDTSQYRAVFALLPSILLLMGAFIGYTYWQATSYRPQLRRLRLYSTTPLANYPRVLVDLLIEREDKQFWSHSGADWRGMHRALRTNIRTLQLAQGGSTITQQMVRSVLLDRDFAKSKSFVRKAIELWLSFWAERELGKRKILELYLQHSFRLAFPSNEGMAAMAQRYFGKPVYQLTPDECAVLVGWLSAPPVNGVDYNRTLALRNATLSTLTSGASSFYLQPLRGRANCLEER